MLLLGESQLAGVGEVPGKHQATFKDKELRITTRKSYPDNTLAQIRWLIDLHM